MKTGRQYKELKYQEYLHLIEHHKKFTDFNRLGLLRSLLENQRISDAERLQLRDKAKQAFSKYYEFLQIKDPVTYVDLETFGWELDEPQMKEFWGAVRVNQELILKRKRIKHRNFGVYSKHLCVHDNCPFYGVMFPQGSRFLDGVGMHGWHDASWSSYLKSMREAKEQRNFKNHPHPEEE